MHDLALYCLVVLVTCVTPGAGVLYTVTSALRGGMRTALCAPLGNLAGVTAVSALSATGLGALVAATPAAGNLLQAAGAAVLLWMGWKNLTAPAVRFGQGPGGGVPARSGVSIILEASLLQVTNPMLIVFLLSLFPQFIGLQRHDGTRVALLIAIFAGTCFCVHVGYSLVAACASRYLTCPRFSLWLNRLSALLFWLLAASVLWNIALG